MTNFFSTTLENILARPVTMLYGFCVLLVIHVIFANGGSLGNDDLVYAYYAAKGVHAKTAACYLCDHFALRWTPVFFTSFFYAFFGINDFTTALFALCCFLLTAVITYNFFRREKIPVIFLAFVLFFFNYNTIFYSHKLVADAGIMLFNFIAWYFYYRERFNEKKNTNLNAFVSGTSLVLAMLTKETIVIIFPFWLLLFLTDLYRKRNTSFWFKLVLVMAALTGIYLFYFQLTTGDWLFRYHVLQNNNYMGGVFFEPHRDAYMEKRLLYELWQAFLLNGDMEYILFAIAGLIYHKAIFNDPGKKLLLYSFAVLLLCCNFMSYSFTEYIPLWSDPRQFLFLIPFAALTGAYVLNAYMQQPRKYPAILICFVIADIFVSFSELGGTRYVYYGITLLLFLRWLYSLYGHNQRKMRYVAPGLFAIVMGANFWYDFFFVHYDNYYDQKMVIGKFFKDSKEDAVVFVGNRISAAFGDYFLSFKNDKVAFANVDTCDYFSFKPNAKHYLLSNERYNNEFAKAFDSMLRIDPMLRQDFRLIEQVGTTKLYEVRNPQKIAFFKPYATSKF